MMDVSDSDKLVAKMLDSYPGKKDLEESIAKTKTQTQKEKIENIEGINYNNKIIPLKTEKLKQVFKRVESQMHDISEYQSSVTYEPGTQISKKKVFINFFRELSSACQYFGRCSFGH